MKRKLLFLLFMIVSVVGFADQKNTCMTCHIEAASPEAMNFRNDVHFQNGLTCADCHGGDPTAEDMKAAMNPAKGFIGKIKSTDIPTVCGTCHGDMQKDFEQSVHGSALKNNAKGPQCISCHGIHNILPVKDAHSPVSAVNVTKTCATCHSNADYIKQFNPGLPVDQYEKYLTSVHGKKNAQGDVKVATCVSCHSNHLIYPVKDPRSPVSPMKIPGTCATCHKNKKYMAEYKIPTDQYDDYVQSVHGVALLKKSDASAPACNSCHGNHGAAPPGIETVAAVCGQCHQANAELYDKSVHHTVFQENSLPGCVVCHSNHLVKAPTDDMIGFHAGSICGGCHANVSGDKAAPVILSMQTSLKGLTKGQEEAEQVLTNAEQLGMDVVEAKYSLKDVNQSLIEARVKVHSFQKEPVQESAAPGLKVIAQAKSAGQAAIKEYYFRRKGLGISTLLLTFVVVLLYLKIRQIENKQHS